MVYEYSRKGKNTKFDKDMMQYLEIEYERNPDLGSETGRAEAIAELFGKSKRSIQDKL